MRATGWLLIVLGVFLSISMAVCASSLLHTIVHDHQFGGYPRWHGNSEFTRTTFELFATVFLFGLLAIGSGIYQVRTGRRHPVLIVLTFLLAGTMAYFTYSIITAIPAPP